MCTSMLKNKSSRWHKKSRRKPHSWRDKEPNVNIKYDLWPLMQIRRKVSRRKSIILLPTIVNIEFFFLGVFFSNTFCANSWTLMTHFWLLFGYLIMIIFDYFWWLLVIFLIYLLYNFICLYFWVIRSYFSLISIQLFRMQFWFLAQ